MGSPADRRGRLRRAGAAGALAGALALGSPVAASSEPPPSPAPVPKPIYAPDLPGGPGPDAGAPAPRSAGAGAATTRAKGISRSRLRSVIDRQMRRAGGGSGAWVAVLRPSGTKRIYARNAGTRRVLASNEKLFSTAAFLRRVGAQGRLRTRVFARGKEVRNGVLRGRLVLVGDGDPALAGARAARRRGLPRTSLLRLARRVHDAGIRRVTRPVAIDDTVFDRRRGIPATGWSASTYLSPLSGLSFNFGYSGSSYASSPETNAGRAFRQALRRAGVRVPDGLDRARVPAEVLAGEKPAARVASPTAARLIAVANKSSSNFWAEMLTKRLAATRKQQGTTRRGAQRIRRSARRLGSGVEAADGSGLGYSNRASPTEVGRLLAAMDGSKLGTAFRDSLAVAGRDGTLRDRMRGSRAQGRCYAKTGTLTRITALSGYCDVTGERRIAFSILMNGVDVTTGRSAQDQIVRAIARHR